MPLNRREFMRYAGAGTAALAGTAELKAQGSLPTSSRELWALARLQPVIDTDLAWLDTAGGAPSLRSVLIEEYRQREAVSRDRERFVREQCAADAVRQLLTSIGRFVGTDAESIALLSGATEALSTVAAGIDLAADDEILTTAHEHPTSVSPWLLAAKRRGVKLLQIQLPHPVTGPEQLVEAFKAALTPRTRVMSFSHVQYTDGSVLPVKELCDLARANNILSIVDGAQAIGMLNTSLQTLGADFYVGSFYKWLNGPAGVGLLALSPAARFRLWPLIVAGRYDWDSAESSNSPLPPQERATWPMSLRKFSAAFTQLAPLALSVLPAMGFQLEVGRERVMARIRELAWYLRLELQRLPGIEILTPAHPSLWAGIVTFRVSGSDGAALANELAQRDRVVVSFVPQAAGPGALRASPHIYNDFGDMDRLVASLKRRLRA
jgi:cysteine desulfurase / selenocysteine lyase